MKSKKLRTLSAAMVTMVAAGSIAKAGPIQLTEYMYSGNNGEFAEWTNLGLNPVNLTGASYDDGTGTPGKVPLSFGVVQPGESVVYTETAAAAFRTAWNLPSTVQVSGPNGTDNLGRADTVNLFLSGAKLDSLTYGDTANEGPRPQNASVTVPATTTALALTTAPASGFSLAATGDIYGSKTSTGGDKGNPGSYYGLGTLKATAFVDTNHDGVQDNGEVGLAGVSLNVVGPYDSAAETTGAGGSTTLSSIFASSYTVSATAPAGYAFDTGASLTNSVPIAGTENYAFGLVATPEPTSVGLLSIGALACLRRRRQA